MYKFIFRSHHAAVALNDRTLCIIGGWDGKKRTADVWLFDIIDCEWKLCKIDSHSSTPAGNIFLNRRNFEDLTIVLFKV